MELTIASPAGDAGTVTVSDATFGRVLNEDLVHQAVSAYLAGARQGTRAQKADPMFPGVVKSPGVRRALVERAREPSAARCGALAG